MNRHLQCSTEGVPQVQLVDSHLHLQDECFAADVIAVVERAMAAGVRTMVCNGSEESDWPTVLELSRRWPGAIVPCLGLHPWYVSRRSARWLETLEELAAAARCGIGEIGLDRWIEPRDEPAQEHAFLAQLDLARRLARPAMVHCLRAWGRLMDLLADQPPLPPMVVHAFGGTAELVPALAARGAYFSFAGTALFERNVRAREALRAVPLDRLLIETDSPDLPPPPQYRVNTARESGGAPGNSAGAAETLRPDGRARNEPANLARIVHGLAALRGIPAAELAEITTANAQRALADIL